MTRRVGDRLERDPVCGHLDCCGQRRQVGRAVDDHAKVAVQLGGLLAQRADESELVERGRSKVMHEPAYVDDRCLGLCTQLEQGLPGARRLVGELVAGAVELQRDPGERGPEPVVEVPAEATALFLASRHQPFPRPLQGLCERDGMRGDAGLPRKVGEQATVRGGEVVLARAAPEHELAHLLAAIEQRHPIVATRLTPRSASTRPSSTTAVYGRRSASPTVSTMEGRTSSGAIDAWSLVPRRESTR